MPAKARRPIVAGNWKMNGSKALLNEMATSLSSAQVPNADIILCLPATLLALAEAKAFALGAQNVSQHQSGAFTGEISTSMLREAEVQYVIIGHSERRELFAESDAVVAAKVASALDAGLTPILCVGESEQIRDSGQLFSFLAGQLDAVIEHIGVERLSDCVLAYEPIWAIGTGKTATPEQAQEVHQFLRQHIAKANPDVAARLQILYGGSVNGSNAETLFGQNDVDGGLVGGASLKAEEFIRICQAANNAG